jgi:hypothetical protein
VLQIPGAVRPVPGWQYLRLTGSSKLKEQAMLFQMTSKTDPLAFAIIAALFITFCLFISVKEKRYDRKRA